MSDDDTPEAAPPSFHETVDDHHPERGLPAKMARQNAEDLKRQFRTIRHRKGADTKFRRP